MVRNIILALLLLIGTCLLTAQAEEAEEMELLSPEELTLRVQALSDSLLQLRESEILTDYGFKDRDALSTVAEKLKIENIPKWKRYLGIEPENPVLDRMSLRKLGITSYKALLAQQYSIHGFTELSTLSELAAIKSVPVKKLRAWAGLSSSDKRFDNNSLQALGKTQAELEEFVGKFRSEMLNYGLTITVFGVLVVFFALSITALVISQLKRLNKEPKKKQEQVIVADKQGKVISHPQDLNMDIIAAAITALHMHKQNIEDRRRLLLTFRRQRADQWHSSAVLSMPNLRFLRKRR